MKNNIKLLFVICLTILISNQTKSQPFTLQYQGITLLPVSQGCAVWGDYNNDGYLDILETGYNSTTPYSKLFKNNGNNTFTEQTGISLTGVGYSSADWGDYNNDGWLDIILCGFNGTANVTKIYKNNGNNTFTEQTGISITGVEDACVKWGDFNNDGWLDIVILGYTGSGDITKIYRNNGDGSFTEQTGLPFPALEWGSIALGDFNNDGYLDIVMTGASGSTRYSNIYQNNGDGTFSLLTALPIGVSNSTSVCADYNNDGWLDLLISGYTGSGYSAIVYQNNGDGTFSNQAGLLGVSSCSASWGDYNNDGLADILLGGVYNSGSAWSTVIYKNNGNGGFTVQSGMGLSTVYQCSLAWGDYDNDGALDLFEFGVANGTGGILGSLFKNFNGLVNTAPSAPTNLQATSNGSNITFKWDKSTDTETAQNGLSYNLYLYESGQSNFISSPQSNISNGFHRVAKFGNIQYNPNGYTLKGVIQTNKIYKWSVQAVDAGLKAGSFATENIFPVNIISQPINDTVCVGSNAQFIFNVTGNNVVYRWYANGIEIPGSNNDTLIINNASISDSGSYYCKVFSSGDSISSNMVKLIVSNNLSTSVATINGLASACPNLSGQVYSINAVAGATFYNWTLPAGWSINGATNGSSISVTTGLSGQGGNISLSAGNVCGSVLAGELAVTVISSPLATASGNNALCNATLMLTGGPDGMNSYSWTGPNNFVSTSQSPKVSDTANYLMSGSYVLTISTPIGCTSITSTLVNIAAPASQPTGFSGSINPAFGSTQTYSVSNVAGVVYSWTFPLGWVQTAGGTSNSVTVTVGAGSGNITVIPSNACGSGAPLNAAVAPNNSTNITSSGSWTCPAGVYSIIAECWGGGGAGGGSTATTSCGGGAGGGCYAKKIVSVIPNTTYTVTVGAVKTGTTTSSNTANTGNPSWFGSSSTVFASGGAGGYPATTTNYAVPGGQSSSSACIGSTVYSGGWGSGGNATGTSTVGAGGGGAGTTGTGTSAYNGTGGSAKANYGGAGANGVPLDSDGLPGSNYGGGGSGGK
ncbi:MAG: FG-GAP-like repeat-containing protein, partial [Bacteroidota bacterium]